MSETEQKLNDLIAEMRRECADLWATRAGHGGENSPAMVNRRVTKYWANRLAEIIKPRHTGNAPAMRLARPGSG